LPIFGGKKNSFFSKTNVVIKFLQKLAVTSLSKKRQYFRTNFSAKIFKNHNAGPRGPFLTSPWSRGVNFTPWVELGPQGEIWPLGV
jgi:hypothetical protein